MHSGDLFGCMIEKRQTMQGGLLCIVLKGVLANDFEHAISKSYGINRIKYLSNRIKNESLIV